MPIRPPKKTDAEVIKDESNKIAAESYEDLKQLGRYLGDVNPELATKVKELFVQTRHKMQRCFEKAIRDELAQMRRDFDEMVAKKVSEERAEMKKQQAWYLEQHQKSSDAELRYRKLTENFVTCLTLSDFKLICQMLHPDRARDKNEETKLNKAFAAFKKLEKRVDKNLPIAKLRETGWDPFSPYYKRSQAAKAKGNAKKT